MINHLFFSGSSENHYLVSGRFRNSASVRPAYYLIGIDFQRRKNEIKEMMDDVDAPRDETRTIFREKVIEGLKGLFRSPFYDGDSFKMFMEKSMC